VNERWTPLCVAILAIAMLTPRVGLLSIIQRGVDDSRSGLLTPADVDSRERLIELGATTALGSFRAIAAVLLWDRAQQLKSQRDWVEYDGVVQLIAKIQPTDIEAYNFQVWNLAYNVQYDAANVEEGWKWVRKGIDLGEKGAKRNPLHPLIWKLYWQLGWTYSHRCGTAVGTRTSYFARRVREENNGRSAYLVAADWYEKAWNAAIQPDARRPNMHHLAMWAYSYEHLAENEEAAGNMSAMIEHRRKAMELHNKVTSKFPEYGKHAKTRVEDLRQLLELHQGRVDAEKLIASGSTREGAELLWKQALVWSKMIAGNPGMKETQRNIDRTADALETVAAKLTDPLVKTELMARVAQVRYWAADPRRRSSEATDALIKAIERIDQLGPAPSNPDLIRDRSLVTAVARMWVRVVINSPGKLKRAQQAAHAIARFDRLAPLVPRADLPKIAEDLTEHWARLLEHSQIDSPLGRLRMTQAASGHQNETVRLAGEVMRALKETIDLRLRGAPMRDQALAFQAAATATGKLRSPVQRTVRFWRVLLRRDKPYAKDASVAEKNLRAVAERLDVCHQMSAALTGNDTTVFTDMARDIWRMLYQHDPKNTTYKEKGGRRQRRPASSAHQHGPGCGH
jgi:tetratricopeptide (TPR) repeat protein